MKNSNTSLNDLFRSAGSEAEKDVLSQSEVERLLQSGRRSVPVTQSIGQQLAQRLLSTPLKIGMTAMTTAACITLGLIAFWPQTSSQPVTKTPISPNVAYSSPGTDAATQHFATLPTSKPSFVVNPTTVATLANAIIPATPIVTADSLQPVELSPDQLAKLGIVLEDNGDIDFYTKVKTTGEVNKFEFPPSWGMILHLGETFPANELASINIPTYPPRLVTQPNGAKRLFTFESYSTTLTTLVGDPKTNVQHLRNEINIMPAGYDSIQENPNDERVLVKIFRDSSLLNLDSLSKISNASFNLDSLSKVLSKSFNLDSLSKISRANFNLDSLPKFPNGTNNWSADMRVFVNHDPNNIEHLVNAIHTIDNADSFASKLELTVDELHDSAATSNIDADLHVGNVEQNQFETIVRAVGSALSEKNIIQSDSVIRNNDLNLSDFLSKSINLNHLIPIRVINLKNAEHPNELIFWYEPTPELTAAMPAAVNSNPVPQSKQLAISVYPNPTLGPATIHYELADAPKAYFSVRNLLGQEVLNGGITSGTTGDAQLDLSQLPAGVYLLVTTTDNGERDVERVVVTK